MTESFQFDVFLSHSSNDKPVVRALAERLRKDGLTVWLDEWVLKAGDSIPAKIEEGLENSRVLVLCISAHALGSDWAQLESQTFRFRDPLNKERRFIPLRLDDAPIKGSLAQFLYINWFPAIRDQEYAKLLETCRPQAKPKTAAALTGHCSPNDARSDKEAHSPKAKRRDVKSGAMNVNELQHFRRLLAARRIEWKRLHADFEAQAQKYPDLKLFLAWISTAH